MKVIPAIDIIEGQCVRLTKGDYDLKKVYSIDPVEVAKGFEKAGIRNLHVVDLDGAKAKHVVNIGILQKIASSTKLEVDFGGGVKTREDLKKVFSAGAKQVTAGSVAANNKEEVKSWIEEHGADKIILGADVLDEKIMTHGWQEDSGEDLMLFLKYYVGLGIEYVICTDISKDGALRGPSFDLYDKIQRKFPDLKLIASGGVSGKEDLYQLKSQGLYGAIVGKAFYEGRIALDELAGF